MGFTPTDSRALTSYSKPQPHPRLNALGTPWKRLNPVSYCPSSTAMHPTSENRGQQHSALGTGSVPPHTRVPRQHYGPQQPGSLKFQVEGVVQPQEVRPPTQWPRAGPGHSIHLQQAAEVSRGGPGCWPESPQPIQVQAEAAPECGWGCPGRWAHLIGPEGGGRWGTHWAFR